MSPTGQLELVGHGGRLVVHTWTAPEPTHVVLLAHGYGEHAGRYAHVADRLAEQGAAVYAPDHAGHGRSDGERVLVERLDDLVEDLRAVADRARRDHPGLPHALLGHSMGGLLAARYAQLDGEDLVALVLSAPVVGGNPDLLGLLALDPIPEVPIDPAVLSRDPAVGQAYAEDPLVWHGAFKRPTLEALAAAVEAVAAGPDLGELPTLWIHGEEDALAPLSVTRPAMEHLRGDHLEEHIYPQARHEVFNEVNRDEVLDDVAGFLARVLAGTRGRS